MLTRRSTLLILVIGCATCSVHCRGREPQRADADAKVHSWATAELFEGQRLVSAREPALAERVRLARLHFANAEAVLVLPRDGRMLAEVHVWLGIAQMQLADASVTPGPEFEGARDHFHIARELFGSVQATSELEGVEHLLRRAADAQRRHP